MTDDLNDRARGAFLGLAIGDALGAPVEFLRRDTFPPVTGFAPAPRWGIGAGDWTDDTSMALCLADSLIARGGYDSYDVMDRYCRWVTDGYRSVNGVCFDIGGQVSAATRAYRNGEKTVPAGQQRDWRAGNGSIMRLAPVTIAAVASRSSASDVERLHAVSARETHYSVEAEAATVQFGWLIAAALHGVPKGHILSALSGTADPFGYVPFLQAAPAAVRTSIKSSGYVRDTLEAAIWAFATTDTFAAAVLAAANLGDDADTVAAVTGQLAGAHYGLTGIPEAWRRDVAQAANIIDLADELTATGPSRVLRTRFEEDPEYTTEPAPIPDPVEPVAEQRRRWWQSRGR